MDTFKNTSEIVEVLEELDPVLRLNNESANNYYSDAKKRYSIEDDINRLFQAFDNKNSGRSSGQPHVVGRNTWQKSALKRPIGVGSLKVSGIGISEPVSLKQALRGLCVSQAAEMAAMKRLSRPAQSLGVSEAVTIKRLYRAVVVEARGSGASLNENKAELVEVSIIPERIASKFANEVSESMQKSKTELVNPSDLSFTTSVDPVMEEIVASGLSSEDSLQRGILKEEVGKQRYAESSSNDHTSSDEISSSLTDFSSKSSMQGKKMGVCNSAPSHSSSAGSAKLSKPYGNSRSLIKPIFQAKNFVKKKAKLELSSFSVISNKIAANAENDKVPKTCEIEKQMNDCSSTHERKENEKASNVSLGVKQSTVDTDSTTLSLSSNCCDKTRSLETISDGRSRSREKGEFSQSSKSSLADYSSSPSISGQSIGSGSSRCGNNRPHMSKNLRWEAIHKVQNQHKIMGLSNFKMLRKLGLGDIGTVYLAELIDTNCLFALKVMGKDLLSNRKKMLRAQTEKEILHMLDHPFLPTLYTHFETDNLMCLVIDYCRGGDLHVLRQKQPSRNFSERAVRFYGAEVLLALEYLHMLGVVYRDLKPENILIREDGHIMLTDFDLSLRCAVNTKVLKTSAPITGPTKKVLSPCDENGCIHPLCLHPSWEVPCFTPKDVSAPSKSRKIKSDPVSQVNPLPQLVVEPISARSNSFVGTHEYLAPEIVKGEGHGNAVDWWTYGVFLFELLYGKTPFKGSSNEDTLTNIASQSLAFPDIPIVSFQARDLIRGLLIKEPENRLGSAKGAAEIKQHPFFGGLNWALIRSTSPPESTRFPEVVIGAGWFDPSKKESTKPEVNENTGEEDVVFELF